MILPSANVTILPNGLGLIASTGDQIHAVFGCCSKGATLGPQPPPAPSVAYSFSSISALTAAFGCGPAVKAAAYAFAKTSVQFLFVRLPATAVNATKSAVDKTGIAGTAVPTISGTPNDNYEVKILITLGGTIGTGPITYKISLDGGVNYGSPISLGSATTITVTGTGITVNLTSTQTFVTNDYFTFHTFAASQSILPVTTTRVASSTCAVTATGSPEDAYEVVVEILKGGTIGTSGIAFRYSLDGGRKFSPKTQLGTATTFMLKDGAEDSGVTLNFASGTLDLGDSFVFNTTAPQWQASDAVTALQNLRANSNVAWSFAHMAGDADHTTSGSIGSTIAGFETTGKYLWAVTEARDHGTNESLATWAPRLADDYDTFADSHIACGAGYARILCPVTGRQNRRSMSWILVPRCVGYGIEIDPGRKLSGALSSDVSITDENNVPVDHDARNDPTLHDARFVTLRTYEDEQGLYITRGNTMEALGGDFNRIPYRRVIAKGAFVQLQVERQQLENLEFVNGAGVQAPLVPGAIRPQDAKTLEREILSALNEQLAGQMVSATVKVDETVNLLSNGGKLKVDTKIVPLAYIDEVDGTIGFTNPAFLSIQTP